MGCTPTTSPSHETRKKIEWPLNEKTLNSKGEERALWFTTTNYANGGTLGRFDLQTGILESSVRLVGADTQLLFDNLSGSEGLFLLTRMHQDGITNLVGPTAEVRGHFALSKGLNPQSAVRDSRGLIWVVAQESNEVFVLSSDLKELVHSIDLSALAVTGEPFAKADLAQLAYSESSGVWVTAQRFNRSKKVWTPTTPSGLALIDPISFKVDRVLNLDLINPIYLHRAGVHLKIVGGGDYSNPEGFMGSALSLLETASRDPIVLPQALYWSGKCLAADFGTHSDLPTVLVWYPQFDQSCIQVGHEKIHCEIDSSHNGYVFTNLKRWGDWAFVSYNAGGKSELWAISLKESNSVLKIQIPLPILSLSFGP